MRGLTFFICLMATIVITNDTIKEYESLRERYKSNVIITVKNDYKIHKDMGNI